MGRPDRAQAGCGLRVAVAVGLVLLLGSGAGYRLLAARLAGLTGAVPLARGTLTRLPREIGDWVGSDVALDERIVEATDTDDHLNRTYTRRAGRGTVALYIAYGVHFRDLMPHRPEVCYPGAGWLHESTLDTTIRTVEGRELPVQIHKFARGGLDARFITVLNYYDVDGQFCPDVSLLRSKGWRLKTQARYMAQVQISCVGDGLSAARVQEWVSTFAAEAAPVIRATLEEAVAEASGAAVPASGGGP